MPLLACATVIGNTGDDALQPIQYCLRRFQGALDKAAELWCHFGRGTQQAFLAGTSGIIGKAIDDAVDLVVVEKFDEHEQKGKGLIDEILQTIVAGIPLLISVPEAALPAWKSTINAKCDFAFTFIFQQLARFKNGNTSLCRRPLCVLQRGLN